MKPALLLRSIAIFVVFLIVALAAGLTLLAAKDRAIDYPTDTSGLLIPEFERQVIDFVPTYDGDTTLPFAAGAVIDIDGDGVEELFFGGGQHQQDAFYRFSNGSFVDITDSTLWSKDMPDKTFGAISLDLDKDGDNDMLVTRQSGVHLYSNDSGKFSHKPLNLNLDAETVPLSVAVADINRDGLYDLYVSGYIARRFVQGETIFNQEYGGVSGLYINAGDDQFTDITEQAGMRYQHNTFQSVFIDIDGDDFEDLVVAHDTGQIRTWKNKGDLTFENIPNPSSGAFSYPMGIAVTDFANDGYPDFFFSNVGSTVPDSLVRGDLRDEQVLHKDWYLFENNGSFNFRDTAEQRHLADYEFSWGAVFEDFNLDGLDDLAVSENYEGWPLHKIQPWRLNGRFLLQSESGQFVETGKQSGVVNREYGITPLTADFNLDGYPDLVHVNLLGPQNVFLSKGGDQGHLKVQLTNTVESVGAKVLVTLEDGSMVSQTFIVGEGLVSDQSHLLIFGLGNQQATNISVRRLDGFTVSVDGPFLNELVEL